MLELLAEGLSNKGIAARLGISDQTVKFHVASICGKLGVANRTEAVRKALRREALITLDISLMKLAKHMKKSRMVSSWPSCAPC